MSEVIGNEIILSDYLGYEDFTSHEELEIFSSIMNEVNPRKTEDFLDVFGDFFGDRRTKPIWKGTTHENIFNELFPFLETQVVFGLGKGAYKKYGVLKYTADFYDADRKTIYEIDGSSHKTKLQKLKDEKRDLILELEFGIKTYRFSNKKVEQMLIDRIRNNKVVERIAK